MPLQENKIKPIVRSVIAAVNRVRLQCGRDEDLAAERAVYAPVQAEVAWDKLFDLWDRNLKKVAVSLE